MFRYTKGTSSWSEKLKNHTIAISFVLGLIIMIFIHFFLAFSLAQPLCHTDIQSYYQPINDTLTITWNKTKDWNSTSIHFTGNIMIVNYTINNKTLSKTCNKFCTITFDTTMLASNTVPINIHAINKILIQIADTICPTSRDPFATGILSACVIGAILMLSYIVYQIIVNMQDTAERQHILVTSIA